MTDKQTRNLVIFEIIILALIPLNHNLTSLKIICFFQTIKVLYNLCEVQNDK